MKKKRNTFYDYFTIATLFLLGTATLITGYLSYNHLFSSDTFIKILAMFLGGLSAIAFQYIKEQVCIKKYGEYKRF